MVFKIYKYIKMFCANQSVLMYTPTTEAGTLIPTTQFLPFEDSLDKDACLACSTDKIF